MLRKKFKMVRFAIVCLLWVLGTWEQADGLSWTVTPKSPQYVLLGSDISLTWDYELAPGETTSGFFQIIWAKKDANKWNNLAINSFQSGITVLRYKEHITVDRNKKATLIITNVTEELHALYRCTIESITSLPSETVQLIVFIPARIVRISESQAFSKGSVITLSCLAKGNPPPFITWTAPDGRLLQNVTLGNYSYSNLTIRDVSMSDIGRYTCTIRNQYGSSTRQTTIALIPTIEKITPKSLTVNETQSASFFCNASGLPNPIITWSRNGAVISTGNILVFNKASRTDTGLYECTASNDAPRNAKESVYVNVQYPVTIVHSGPANQVIKENNAMSIFCNATGNPAPTITWLKDGNQVFVGNRLLRLKAQLEDQGNYTCLVSNGIGTPQTAVLNVVVLAAATVIYISESKSIRLGMSVSLSCIGKGNPHPYVAWISPNGTMLQNKSSLSNTNLTINNVTRPYCGVYTCIASNMYGTDKKKTSIVLPPIIETLAPKLKTIYENESAYFYCNASGYPKPSIQWSKSGDGSTNFPAGSELILNKATRKNGGIYICTATNGLFVSATSTVVLRVLFKPTDATKNKIIKSWIGKETVVTCEISGVPPPVITWSRPAEKETDSVNGTTTISKLSYKATSFRDFGDFECYAKNSLGDIAITITVKQIVAPDPPLLLRVEPSDAQVKVTWKVPKSADGTPVSFYFVQAKQNDARSETWKNCTNSTTICNVGVPYSAGYNVRLLASNFIGSSTYSEVKVSVTEVDVTLVNVACSNTQLLDKKSSLFISLAKDIEVAIWRAYRSVTYLRGVSVTKFTLGSVVAHIRLTHDACSEQPLLPLKDEIVDGYLGDIRVDIGFPTALGRKQEKPNLGADTAIGVILPWFLVILVTILLLLNRKRRQAELEEEEELKKSTGEEEKVIKPVANRTVEYGYSEDRLSLEKRFEEKQFHYTDEKQEDQEHDTCDGVANVYKVSKADLFETSRSPPETEQSKVQSPPGSSTHEQPQSPENQTIDHQGWKSSSKSTSYLIKDNISLQEKTEPTDKLYLKLAWLESRAEEREHLPSIRLVKGPTAERKSV